MQSGGSSWYSSNKSASKSQSDKLKSTVPPCQKGFAGEAVVLGGRLIVAWLEVEWGVLLLTT
jgi:hypothetical protein